MFKLFLIASFALIGSAVAQVQHSAAFHLNRFNPYYNRGFYNSPKYYNRGYAYDPYYNGQYYRNPYAFNRRTTVYSPTDVAFDRPASVPTVESAARILSERKDTASDGSYQFHYETENGIQAHEINQPRVLSNGRTAQIVNNVQGSYSYTAPNGEVITVTYTADENGFHPVLHGGQASRGPAPASVQIAGPTAIKKI